MRMGYALASALLVSACGSSKGAPGIDSGSGTGTGDGPVSVADADTGPFPDFPADPIVDSGPTNSGSLFGDPSSGAQSGGPCLIDPAVGTLFPQNWLRPRFTWAATAGENLFELRVTTANEVNPLVVYTTSTTWTMPANMWSALSQHIVDQPMTVTVRGATLTGTTLSAGPSKGSSGDITIAPASAPGAIVYWTTSGGTALRGFHVGDETVTTILTPTTTASQCVGCHSSTPDGTDVGYSYTQDSGNGDPAMLGLRSADGQATLPTFPSTSAKTLMARTGQELPVFTKMHWATGDHKALTMFQVSSKFEITWTDLEATSTAQNTGWGVVARTGDTNPAAYASFAHTTDTVLYVSSSDVASGVTVHNGNLYTVPYSNGAGGTATPVTGASSASYNEYYPTFSPDDRFIAFNRIPNNAGTSTNGGAGSSYANTAAEVFIIQAAGGTAQRLAANDPPSCQGVTSPGIQNSWPKWSPVVTTVGVKKYYWLTFSSLRMGSSIPQLFVTPVVDDGQSVTTYPALYLWNQPSTDHNHTPAWDNFDIVVN